MNPLLIFLGAQYTLRLKYELYSGYKVTVNQDNFNVSRSFSPLKAEIADHDVLLYTIEQCIMDLQERTENKIKIAEERAQIKQRLNEYYGAPQNTVKDQLDSLHQALLDNPFLKNSIEGKMVLLEDLKEDLADREFRGILIKNFEKGNDNIGNNFKCGVDLSSGPDFSTVGGKLIPNE